MKMFLISVKDRKGQVFTQPQGFSRLEAGIRSFSDSVNDPNPQNLWYKHPGDFELYHIGSYDDQTGRLEPLGDPVLLASGDEYRRPGASSPVVRGNNSRTPDGSWPVSEDGPFQE